MKTSQNSVARTTDSLNPSLSQLCPNQTFCVELHCQTTLLSRVISVLLYGACTELGIHGLICTWGKLVVHRLPDRTKEKYSLLWFWQTVSQRLDKLHHLWIRLEGTRECPSWSRCILLEIVWQLFQMVFQPSADSFHSHTLSHHFLTRVKNKWKSNQIAICFLNQAF